ncbi:tetratricopeptide repeat protein [Streptomyces roseochromogenus]|uniref:tetratricopeptide repeat protein n=1 Tax=Streptomyces roseochromogenus TaxID=285450 RepID=UPI0007C5503B|nr:tetratricopeptide repeat protein [Streptomyces roseochromogenus]
MSHPGRGDAGAVGPRVSVADHGRLFNADRDQVNIEIGSYTAQYSPGGAAARREHVGPDSVRVPLAAASLTPIHDRHDLRRLLLRAACHPDASDSPVVVHGMGGCGKTAIVRVVFDEAVGQHGVIGLWVNASTAPTFREGMLAVAQDRGASQDEVDAARDRRRAAADLAWYQLERSSQPWLLVLDNADDPSVLGDEVWLRPTRRGTILVTTRFGTAAAWRRAERHHLDVLGLDDAVDVLIDLEVPSDTAELEELARALGCHPLALVLAGSYLGRRFLDPVTVDEFLERLRNDPNATLDEAADPDERDLRRLISSTWQISLDALADRGLPEAITLIRLLSCFASDPLPTGVLHPDRLRHTGLDRAEPPLPGQRAEAALRGLMSHSMVSVDDVPGDVGRPGVPCVQTHALLLDTVAARIPLDQREIILAAAATLLEDLLTREAGEGLLIDAQSLRLFTPHVVALLERVVRARSAIAHRALALARYLRAQSYDRGDFATAHAVAKAVVDADGSLDAPDTAESLADRYELGRILSALGRYEQAKDLLEEVLVAHEAEMGPDHLATLACAHELALVFYGLGAWSQDEHHMRRAVDGRSSALGLEAPDTIVSTACLAEAVGEQQRWQEAVGIARPNAERAARALGDEDPVTLTACHTLAWILFKSGQIDEARALVERILAVRGRLLGAEHPRTLTTRALLANILRSQQQWELAAQEALSVLEVRERILGAEHPHTLGLRNVLIRIRLGAGDLDAAVALAEANLEACHRVLGDDHPDTASCRQALQEAHTAKESQR